MTDIPPPAYIGDRLKEVDVTGYLFPWNAGQPFFLKIEGSDSTYIPVFENKEKLDDAMDGIPYQKVKKIDDGWEFLDSIPLEYTVIVNLVKTEGKCRYTQIFRT